MNSEIKDTFTWHKDVTTMINKMNNKTNDWKEDILVDFALHKINGYNVDKLTPLNNLSYLELIKLTNEFDAEGKVVNEIKYGLIDSNGELIGYDDNVEYIYTTNDIEDARLTSDETLAKEMMEYFNEEYNDGILGKHPELKFPMKVVEIEIDYKITEIDALVS